MPLVRFQLRNQYGLGQPDLYAEADREDPKAVLDGVAVAGLVGILRQLGDLAEFAGEVFHGLQEQVTTIASRSHSLVVRVKNIEAALPPIEKAIQAQTNHIHFAYTAGLEWHPHIQNEQNHFIYNDLPRFIMDSYEECRDPPRLHLLDRFDTGGSGSCMKRYSDPTFFRRVSTSSCEKNTEKIRKDKKARKIKKKKRSSSLRNGEYSRGTSVYSCSGRMQFASSIGNGQASPSQTASTVDRTLKSDHGEHSNSFDSRTGSGYIECVFPRGSSMQSEEQESKKASPRSLQHIDTIDLVFSDDHNMVVDDINLHGSFEEKIAPSSSCVSWEEKEEIVEPKDQLYDEDGDQDILLEKSEIDMLNSAAVNTRNIDPMDTEFDNENALSSTSDRSELDDDIESETDNYVDALNTIESEAEYDLECQTKRELKLDSNKGVPSDLPENKPAIKEISSNSDHSPGIDICERVDAHDDSNVDYTISNALPSGSSDQDLQDQSGKKVIASFSGSQESPEISGSQSVKLWTNGGLLGLQPSKPPDFAVSNTERKVSLSTSEKDTVGPPNHVLTIKDVEGKGKVSMLNENDRSNQEAISNDRKDCTPTGRKQARLNVKDEESDDFLSSNRCSHANESGRIVPSPVSAEPEVSVASDGNATSIEPNVENDERSSSMFGLSHRLLVNGFRRKLSLVPDDKPILSNSLKRIPETAFREQFEPQLSQHSPTSSPPLEHMKISFHPVNGYETSQLKLKFHDGTHSLESVEDMFPAFQLVPDSAVLLRNTNSDSDDDTFCRSTPYMSDDCHSPHSETNSEEWEVSENSGSKDREPYDAFCRVPGSEFVSSSSDPWEAANDRDGNHLSIENGVEHSLCGPLQEPPILNVVNPETKGDSDPTQPDPLPPPLPPVQWRLMKTHAAMEEEPHAAVSEAPKHVFDLEFGKPSISQQAQIDHVVGFKPRSEEQPTINGHNEANLVSNGKSTVEKGGFLHQIRTQSLNLRSTTPATVASAPASNVSVTAILEKANAIRQAVASDDGEEDTWSDT